MSMENDKYDQILKDISKDMLNNSSSVDDYCPDEEDLSAYAEGRLSKHNAENIEKHIAHCENCADLVASVYNLRKSLSEDELDQPDQKLVSRAKLIASPSSKSFINKLTELFETSFGPVPVLATAALILLATYIGYNQFTKVDDNGAFQPVREFNLVTIRGIGVIGGDEHTAALTDASDMSEKALKSEVKIKEGSTLYTGENYTATFTLNQDAYVYFVVYDEQEGIIKVFPEGNENRLAKRGRKYRLPVYWLGESTGKKKTYLILSKTRIPGFDKKLNEINERGPDQIKSIFPGAAISSSWFIQEK